MATDSGSDLFPIRVTDTCASRIEATLVEMKKPGDTLELGECIGTKGTRICDRQGTFDRVGGPWNPAPDCISALEKKHKLMITTEDLKEYQALHGDFDKIARRMYNQDIEKVGDESDDDDEDLTSRRQSIRGLVSPAKDGEDQNQKLADAKKKNHKKAIQKVYQQWQDAVKKYSRDNSPTSGTEAGTPVGEKARTSPNPWNKTKLEIADLRQTIKNKDAQIKKLKDEAKTGASREGYMSTVGHDIEIAAVRESWKRKYEEAFKSHLEEKQKLKAEYEALMAEVAIMKSDASAFNIKIKHLEEMRDNQVQLAEKNGFIKGMMSTQGRSINDMVTPTSNSLDLSFSDM